MIDLSRIDRVTCRIGVEGVKADGSPATIDSVDISLLPLGKKPTGATTWVTGNYSLGSATILLAGPDASPAGALVVPETGGAIWVRATDNPEVKAVEVTRVRVS